MSSLCLALALLIPRAAAARKLFIREIVVDRACISASPQALLALIAQQVPRDVLARRGLEYEDLPSYLDVANWSPERFEVRESTNILRRLRQLDMQMMLWLDVSCLPPTASGDRFLLTGRLTNLDAMDTILACPEAQAGTRDGRRICHVGGDVYDAVSYTHANLRTFDDFVPAVRQLLARLLHVPEVSVGTPRTLFDAGETVEIPFLVRRNDGTEPGFAGAPAVVRRYRMAQDVLQVPPDLYDEVCRAPQERWDQLACRAGFREPGCDAADAVRFQVRSLVRREIDAHARDDVRGGDRIAFAAPPHVAWYVVRAEAIADEAGGEVRSNPVFRCIRVAPRPVYLGVGVRLGPATDITHGIGSVGTGSYPSAEISSLPFGLDLEATVRVAGTPTAFLPSIRVGVALGLTTLSGVYPCRPEAGAACPDGTTRRRVSSSVAFELRGVERTELFRVGPFSLELLADIGIAVESATSSVERWNPCGGVHPVFLSGVGLGGALTFGRHEGVGTQFFASVMPQVRYRLDNATCVTGGTPPDGFIDVLGVPNAVGVLWFSLGVRLAPPFGG